MDSDIKEVGIDYLKMPESVAVAVIKIIGLVKHIKKENKNTFDSYLFASIDDFMEYINPKMAEAGLIIMQTESKLPELKEKAGKNGPVLMLWCEYNFYLYGADGAGFGPIVRTVMVQATGAQAFGSAQSYTMKQFQRSLFQIPTGDKDDPDIDATKEIANPPSIDAQAMAKRINRSISSSKTEKALDEVSVKYNDDLLVIKTTSAVAYDFLVDAIKKRRDQLNEYIETDDITKQREQDLKAPE